MAQRPDGSHVAARRIRPGPFESAVFRPSLRALIPAGWRGWEYRDTILLFLRDEHGELTIDAAGPDAGAAGELVDSLRRTPGLRATDVQAVQVGGLAGSAFDADASQAITFDDRSGKRADRGDHVRAIALAHPEQALSLVLVARAEAFRRVAAAADPIVRTLEFPA